jgi:hypothetical protein
MVVSDGYAAGGGLAGSGVWSPDGAGAATLASGLGIYNGVPVAGNESSWHDEVDTSVSVANWESQYVKTTSGAVGAGTAVAIGPRSAITYTNTGGIVSLQSILPPVRARANAIIRLNACMQFDSGSEAILGLVKVGITTPFTAISDGIWLYKGAGSLTPTLYSAHASASVNDAFSLPLLAGIWHELTLEVYGGTKNGRGVVAMFLDGHPVATIDGVDICSDQALAVHMALKGSGSFGIEHVGRVVRSATSK